MAFIRKPQFSNPVTSMVKPVIDILIAFEGDMILKRIEDICRDNKAFGGTDQAYFYEGQFFSALARSSFKGINVKPINKALHKQAQIIVKRKADLETMRQILTQSFAVVARACKSKQDLRDILPDTLVAEIPSLREIERFRDEGVLLNERPDIFQQYQRAVEIALQLKGKRLIHG